MIIFNRNLGISSEDVARCNDLQLLKEWQLGIEEDLVAMILQINKAKSDAFFTGQYADPNWFRAVESARKLQGLLKQQITHRIAFLKQNHSKQLERYFVDVAFEKLSSELFQQIKAEALQRKELAENSS